MILVSNNGLGKVVSFCVNPWLVGCLVFLIGICICSVPLLEKKVINLVERLQVMEKKKRALESDIYRLEYVKRSLARFEEKEKFLRDYFGMEGFGFLEKAIGVGGDYSLAGPSDREAETNEAKAVKMKTDHSGALHSIPEDFKEKIETLIGNLEVMNRLAVKQVKIWDRTPSIFPVDLARPKISSGFGWRTNPFTERKEFHAGIDIIGPKGTKIIAPASGVVVARGYDRWLGNFLVLSHGNGLKTIYGHMEKIQVQKGMEVKRGDCLGLMGNTGLSTSRHLHYGVIAGERVVDPMQFILERGVS